MLLVFTELIFQLLKEDLSICFTHFTPHDSGSDEALSKGLPSYLLDEDFRKINNLLCNVRYLASKYLDDCEAIFHRGLLHNRLFNSEIFSQNLDQITVRSE